MKARSTWLVGLLIAAAVVIGYHQTLRAPFVFDDLPTIIDNETIRQLWPLTTPLSPPKGGFPVSGRPLVNLSLAFNYAISGIETWSYHATNLALHGLAALALFAVLRRTLRRPVMPAPVRTAAVPLAGAIALLWAVHPLQTAAVTYVVQRAEVLASLFYLLTLLAFIRSIEEPARARRWTAVAVTCCTLGMASKEIMASAPLVVLLYDRTFVAGTFRTAWRERGRLHLALAATWLLLAWLVLGTKSRGGTAGFGLNITPLEYLLTQAQAIIRYLGLVVWPHPLVFDYGVIIARGVWSIVPFVVLIVLLMLAVAWALRRRPLLGFAGVMFFAVLAPSSSIVPVATQTMAEHRMYLPLALVLALGCVGIFSRFGPRALILFALAAIPACTAVTFWRNQDFKSPERLWRDTAQKRPGNARAHNNLAVILLEDERGAGAVASLEEAVRLQPGFADAQRNYSQALLQTERLPDALARADEALRLDGGSASSHNLRGSILFEMGRRDDAIAEYRQAIQLDPRLANAHNNLGDALRQAGDFEAARAALETALRLNPQLAEAHYNLGQLLLQLGQTQAALAAFERAVELKPGLSAARQALASALFLLKRTAAALAQGREAVRQAPVSFRIRYNFGNDLAAAGLLDEAIVELQEARRLRPDSVEARYNLANALNRAGRIGDAITEYQEVMRLAPTQANAHLNLGAALMQVGRPADALPHFESVLRLASPSPEAHCALGFALVELGREREATAAFRAALELNSNYAPAQEGLRIVAPRR